MTGRPSAPRIETESHRRIPIPPHRLSISIMPGTTNGTRSVALAVVGARVIGNQTMVTVAGARGRLEFNTFRLVIIQAALQSATLLGDAAWSFALRMVARLEPDRTRIAGQVATSLMLPTALNPRIGSNRAIQEAKLARTEDLTRRDAASRRGHVAPEDLDRRVRPEDMLRPGGRVERGG